MTKTLVRKNYLTRGKLGNRVWKKVLTNEEIIDKAKIMASERGDKLRDNLSLKSAVDYLNKVCFDYFSIEPYHGIIQPDWRLLQ